MTARRVRYTAAGELLAETPGPWTVQAVEGPTGHRIEAPPPPDRDWSGDHVGNVYRLGDAYLAAAAPEMLAALEYIVHWEATEGWSPDRARDMAVAAIAKARSEVAL